MVSHQLTLTGLRSPDWFGSSSTFDLDSLLEGLIFSFWFTARLSRRYRSYPCPLPPTLAQPSSISTSPPAGTFITTDQPLLMHHNHSKSIVFMRVHSWCVSTIITPHRASWNPSVIHLLIFPSLLTPGSHWSLYCLHGFVFSKVS